MVRPAKRKKLWIEHEETARRDIKEDIYEIWRRQVQDVTVAVTATVEVGVDDDGKPIATDTILPPSSATSVKAASATATQSAASSASVSASPASSAAISTSSRQSSASAASITSSPSPSPSSSGMLVESSEPSQSNIIIASLASFSSSSEIIATSLISSSSILQSSTSEPLSSSSLPYVVPTGDAITTPIVAGIPGADTTMTTIPTAYRGNSTSPLPSTGASPPVVAGAVVGSVGGVAVVLLIIVLLARYWKQKGGGSRTSNTAESTQELHTSPAPIMSHRHPARRSFLPPGAIGWINRLSGSHYKRSSSPTLPNPPPPAFEKIAGRKLPSQFPTGGEDGPMRRDFVDPDAIQPAMSQDYYRQTGVSGTSSYYHDPHDSSAVYYHDQQPTLPIIADHPNMDRDHRDTAQFFDPRLAGAPPIPRRARSRDVMAPNIPPLFDGARSTTPSPPEEYHAGKEMDYGHPGETLMPSPARTPNYHPQGHGRNESPGPGAGWRSPQPPGYFPHDSWPEPPPRRH